MRSSWGRVGCSFKMTGVLRKHTGRTPCDDRGRDWSDAAAIQGVTRIDQCPCSPHQELGQGKQGFFPESQREHGPASTFISDFQPPEL